jgi:nucleoside-triphosphatase THEP1
MTYAADRIATVVGADGAATQALLAAAAAGWRAAGVKVVGVTAETHGLPDRICSAGFLRDIASGKSYPIYLETAPRDTSCHLDAAGVDAACAAIRTLIQASDLVVLSKFGKLEAMRRGLAPAFEAATAAGKPILTTVSEKHREAWRAFAPSAVDLAADDAAIQGWWRGLRVSA